VPQAANISVDSHSLAQDTSGESLSGQEDHSLKSNAEMARTLPEQAPKTPPRKEAIFAQPDKSGAVIQSQPAMRPGGPQRQSSPPSRRSANAIHRSSIAAEPSPILPIMEDMQKDASSGSFEEMKPASKGSRGGVSLGSPHGTASLGSGGEIPALAQSAGTDIVGMIAALAEAVEAE